MDIMGKANELFEQGKAALDGNADGKIDAKEVLDALGERVKETAEAGAEAVASIKEGFDANADGAISVDEVKAVGEAVAAKAKETFDSLVGKGEEVVGGAVAEPEVVEERVVEEAVVEEVVEAEAAVEEAVAEEAAE